MPKSYIVTVTTEDGTLLTPPQTGYGLFGLLCVVLRLFNHLWSLFKDTDDYMTGRGSGTQSSASPSHSSTES
jgi:hypothetical protein